MKALIFVFFVIFLRNSHQQIPENGPILTFHPKPLKYYHWLIWTTQPTLIHYIGSEHLGYKNWTNALDAFIDTYRPNIRSGVKQICNFNTKNFPDIACNIDVRSFGPCVLENLYGYHRNSPCVFLTFKELFGWTPEYYNDPDLLPSKMPKRLKEHISKVAEKSQKMLNTVWISCDGIHAADKEYIGPVKYFPFQGFPGYFFPYSGQDDYLSPLVAVQFERPARHILINIECKAWARNIEYNVEEHIGIVQFELFID
ncbi:sodium/potassium-transporting ATPase subunit beta-2-like [Culicoides brevitarsis]|uniref:sodium/potassium-transporting ATPase subunit beta-2-like n=1 Tax=Culicoides brevitarsis TaxID=469753 RepID=UPI00307BF576